MTTIPKNPLVHSTYGVPQTDRNANWYGVWSANSYANDGEWLEAQDFPVMILNQYDYDIDGDGNNCEVLTIQGTVTNVNSVDLDFKHWEDLNPIEQRILSLLYQRGIQLPLRYAL